MAERLTSIILDLLLESKLTPGDFDKDRTIFALLVKSESTLRDFDDKSRAYMALSYLPLLCCFIAAAITLLRNHSLSTKHARIMALLATAFFLFLGISVGSYYRQLLPLHPNPLLLYFTTFLGFSGWLFALLNYNAQVEGHNHNLDTQLPKWPHFAFWVPMTPGLAWVLATKTYSEIVESRLIDICLDIRSQIAKTDLSMDVVALSSPRLSLSDYSTFEASLRPSITLLLRLSRIMSFGQLLLILLPIVAVTCVAPQTDALEARYKAYIKECRKERHKKKDTIPLLPTPNISSPDIAESSSTPNICIVVVENDSPSDGGLSASTHSRWRSALNIITRPETVLVATLTAFAVSFLLLTCVPSSFAVRNWLGFSLAQWWLATGISIAYLCRPDCRADAE